jgi:nitrogen fixation protein NifU and related proteins
MSDDLYQEIILEEYAHPHHFGKMADADLTLPGINASCGDALMIYIKLDPDKKKILTLSWDGEGCAISMAAMSVVAQKVNSEQMSIEDLAKITKEDIEALLGLEETISGRVKCLNLGIHTLQANLLTKAS